MYPPFFCHFCDTPLVMENSGSFFYCDCRNAYSSLHFNTGRFNVQFKCGDFKFLISEFETVITDMTCGKSTYDVYRIDVPILVNNNNYLSVVEKVKKLQAFK